MTSKTAKNTNSKYQLDQSEKEQIFIFLKRAIKVILTIFLFKLIRRLITTNKEAHDLVSSAFVVSESNDPEQIILFIASSVMVVGLLIWGFGLSLLGKKILKMNFFNTIIIIVIVDAVMMLLFPEITVAVLRAILLIE